MIHPYVGQTEGHACFAITSRNSIFVKVNGLFFALILTFFQVTYGQNASIATYFAISITRIGLF